MLMNQRMYVACITGFDNVQNLKLRSETQRFLLNAQYIIDRCCQKTIAFAIRSVDRWVTLHVFCQPRRTAIRTDLDAALLLGFPA